MQPIGFNIVFPLIAILLAGYLAGYLRLFPADSSRIFGRFVFLIAMPPFIFIALVKIPPGEFFNWPFLAVLGGGMLGVATISFLVARWAFPDSLTAHSLHGLTAMFSSTAYIGIPIILLVFGQAGLVPGIVGAVITVTLFMPLAIILIELDRGRSGQNALGASLVAVMRNPLLIATAAGLLTSASGISLATPIVSFCELLGGAFIPCALFSAGIFISGCSIKGEVREISWLILAKLVLHPLITWWLAYRVFELDGILAFIAVLQAALPTGVPVFVLAQHYNSFVTRSSAVIVLSTLLSIFSIAAVFILLTP